MGTRLQIWELGYRYGNLDTDMGTRLQIWELGYRYGN